MNPLTHFKRIRILPLFSLGAIFALVTAAHAQNLYVSAHRPQSDGGHAILEFTPSGTRSTYALGLLFPRGLAFDSTGNLFAAETVEPDNHDIGRALKFNLRNHRNTVGSVAKFFFEGLAVDIAGNAYVMANDDNSPTAASTIFKFTPDGERIVFGSVPSQGWGLAFDSVGNLYAAEGGVDLTETNDLQIRPGWARTVFAGPDAFPEGEYPVGLAFDSHGNLFVSIETFTDPGADSIVYFSPTGAKSPFATGLNTPRGLAFDSSGNLFVAEASGEFLPGDILKFPSGGGMPEVFASGFFRPQFLTFGPPR